MHFVDQLRIVARGEGRDRGTGEAREVGGTAQFLEPLVIFHERLDRHRRGERVLRDALFGDVVDAPVHGFVEMLGPHDLRHAVIDLVVRQNRAEKLLFGLDIMRDAVRRVVFSVRRLARPER